MSLVTKFFGADKAINSIAGAVDKIVGLIPEGDAAKRTDAANIARETLERIALENSGTRIAQIVRAVTPSILTATLVGCWIAGVQVEKVELMGVRVGIGEAAMFALAFWFSGRGLLGLVGGKK